MWLKFSRARTDSVKARHPVELELAPVQARRPSRTTSSSGAGDRQAVLDALNNPCAHADDQGRGAAADIVGKALQRLTRAGHRRAGSARRSRPGQPIAGLQQVGRDRSVVAAAAAHHACPARQLTMASSPPIDARPYLDTASVRVSPRSSITSLAVIGGTRQPRARTRHRPSFRCTGTAGSATAPSSLDS